MRDSQSKNLRRLAFGWLSVLAWGSVILFIGTVKTVPLVEGELIRLFVRKAIHMAEYAIFGLLLYRAVADHGRPFSPGRAAIALLMTVAFAAIDEWRQTFIPMRSGQITDVGIDGIGAGLGLLIAKLKTRNRFNVGTLKN